MGHRQRGTLRLAIVLFSLLILAYAIALIGWRGGYGLVVAVCLIAAVSWVADGYKQPGPIGRARQIRTKRLTLRRAVLGDVPAMHAILSDAETLRYWDSPPHQSIEQTETWIAHLLDADDDNSDEFIVLRDGEVIGWLGAKHYPWITYMFARHVWDQGYATEALSAFTGYMFERGLNLQCAVTDAANARSLALLHRLGFEEYQRGPLTHEALGVEIESVSLVLYPPGGGPVANQPAL
ncbi:GNAT family N-acetyltransferase [Sphingomonas sp. AOB5]|uniref:GNAT family N-acetyltransferase n=1 Tax=Sphingomonas sp. AOB5 TaxID=3034017 RepID=UPI0023F64714|nr:GNAT family N-acetyltransferase [Sphingomonas sp. AOB5]MDF7776416.1 GNAT family N-acetyltransferase [Sphingomonas sp. AOB5]